ncbi:MAG TPA: 3'-5' exonuclease [Acidobacteriota bacterium]|nr:3'-5' exonuclease [Acidobacteriota bacterium]
MKVFWLDLETGGLDPEVNPILQLGYVIEINGRRVREGRIISSGFEGCEIHPEALEVNGLDPKKVEAWPPESEMYEKLIGIVNTFVNRFDKTDKFVIGGFNVGFDVEFLRAMFKRQKDKYFGAWFAFQFIDPASIVRFIQYAGAMDEFARMKLTDLAKYFQVDRPDAHDALADIEMTIDVVRKMKELLQ